MKHLFERQWLHLIALAILIYAVQALAKANLVRAGQLWGVESLDWLLAAVWTAVAHQVWVATWWRLELHLRLPSRVLGRASFPVYATGFSILGIARMFLVWCLAVANQGPDSAAALAAKILAVIMIVPSGYLLYSVNRYFGFRRAFGYDHWDPSYKDFPLVREGIFRYTANGMYTFGFFIFWIPGFWFGSVAALLAALFNHF